VLKHVFDWSEKICIEGIRPVRSCGQVAPVLVHPEPGRGILSHIRLERIPTGLGDLLMSHLSGTLDLWMEDEPVTSVGQRFAVRRKLCGKNKPQPLQTIPDSLPALSFV
jgi:hypothetical protein